MASKDLALALAHHHRLLCRLAQRVCSTAERLARKAAFDQLAKAVGGHLGAIETVVLPALLRLRTGGLASELLDVLQAHMALKRQLADLLAMNRKTDQFDESLQLLCHEVLAHCERERAQLLPCVQTMLQEADRAMLAPDFEMQMRARLGDAGSDMVEPILQARVQDLLQEAQVVLASLPHGGLSAPGPEQTSS